MGTQADNRRIQTQTTRSILGKTAANAGLLTPRSI